MALNSLKQHVNPKMVLVGLDGVPYSLLQKLSTEGCIPRMASLFAGGYFGPMSVSIPEISSVSWSSFMTGAQPGEHGIYGFMDLQPNTYKLYFPNFRHLKSPTLWDDLGRQGKKTVVINMPATYPAREIQGALISGFVAIDINKAVYPSFLIPKLKDMDYRIDVDTLKGRQDHDFLFNDLEATLLGRERAVDLLWDQVDWDLLILVVTGTDRLMHFLWDAIEDENHPHHPRVLSYFAKLDAFIGRVHDRFMKPAGSSDGMNVFCMLSDHGFAKIKTEVYLNRWLQEKGYLKFRKEPPDSIMDIGPGTTAFALDPSRIYINTEGKYPLGTVAQGDYLRVRQEIKEGLEDLRFQDEHRVVREIFLKEDLYRGPQAHFAPDLVLLSNKGYDLKGKANSPSIFGRTDLQGMHTQDDAFFYSSSGVQCKSIFDAKGIIMDALG